MPSAASSSSILSLEALCRGWSATSTWTRKLVSSPLSIKHLRKQIVVSAQRSENLPQGHWLQVPQALPAPDALVSVDGHGLPDKLGNRPVTLTRMLLEVAEDRL